METRVDPDFDSRLEPVEQLALRINRMMDHNNYADSRGRAWLMPVVGIIAICVTIILSALGISSQFASFEGEMREWKRATEARLTQDDERAERDEQMLFLMRGGPAPKTDP
jgi:hypothetical protein